MKTFVCSFIVVLSTTLLNFAADDYKLGPDSIVQEGVPRGTVTHHEWRNSKVFAGTEREYWIYVPKQYDPTKPASLLVRSLAPPE